MNKKKFDSTTARKIISEYADKLNYYIKENNSLKAQLEDIKVTLNINKELLFKYISTNINHSEQKGLLEDFKNENSRLVQKNDQLVQDKIILDKKVLIK
jgi:hypothetical protein